MPRLRWGDGSGSLHGAILYVVFFVLALVGLPTLVVWGRWLSMPRKSTEFTIRLLREDLGKVVEMDLEEYLAGVMAAEMPADFHCEALKAQAVAARTYALYRLGEQRNEQRDSVGREADLSSDFRSGQAWMSAEAQRERWGWYAYFQKRRSIIQSVEATRGEVITYRGEPIFAAYHSTSGGFTQAAGDYFNEVPYLQGVPSPGEEISPYYRTTKQLSWREAATKLGLEIPIEVTPILEAEGSSLSDEPVVYEPPESGDGQLTHNPDRAGVTTGEVALPTLDLARLFHITQLYPTGRVKNVEVLGQSFTGRQIREKLGLRSNWFSVIPTRDGIIFEVRGNGHGVGMSQYGAQRMAMAGYSYQDILLHYYTDIELVKWY
ncbi:MAG: SpoIID/LytB domain-containing protein [Firmicutes bacterium]|nr:SpoIID/LytB domain-containing protein [Bacillota bacterium]